MLARTWRWLVVGATALSLASCLTSIGDVNESNGKGGRAGTGGASTGGTSTGGTGGTVSDSGVGGSTDANVPDGAAIEAGVPGLLGHWPFDDTPGLVAVDVVGSHNAQLPSEGVGWTVGKFGTALQFSAPTTPVTAPNWYAPAFPGTGTVTMWLYTHVIANDASSRGIFSNYDSNTNHVFVRRANGSVESVLQCALQQAATPYPFAKNVAVASDVWQLVAVAWSPSLAYCYVHGTKLEGAVAPGWAPSDQAFAIGEYFDGRIDDLRLYDHLLTDQELADLLASGAAQ